MRQTQAAASGELKRCLGLHDLVFFGVGKMVGAGILVLIGVAAEHAGNAVCLSYLVAAAAACCSALCYCEAMTKVPVAGGSYSIVYACLGEFPAFLVGWMVLFEYACGAAALSRAWAMYLIEFLQQLGEAGVLDSSAIPGWLHPIGLGGGYGFSLLATIYLCCLVIVVAIGITQSSVFNMVAAGCKVTALVFAIVVAFMHADSANWEKSGGFAAKGVEGVLTGGVTVFYAYVGFDAMSTTAEETLNPQVTLPLGMIISIIITSLIYVLVSLSITLMVPYTTFIDSAAPLAGAFKEKGIGWMVLLISFCACIGLVSGVILNLVSQARIWMCLARDGLVPSRFSTVHSWTQTPLFATLVAGTFALMLASFLEFSTLASMVSLGAMIALTSVNLSLIPLRYHEARMPAPWSHLGGFVLAVSCATMSFKLTRSLPGNMSSGLALLCLAVCILSSLFAAGIGVLIAWRLPRSTDPNMFVLPCAGVVSLLGTAVNVLLMFHIKINVFAAMTWFILGLIWYGSFGFRNSKLNPASETTGLL